MEDPLNLNQQGLTLANEGKLQEAMACFSMATALKPDFPAALNNLGCMQQFFGRFMEAIDSHKKALAIRPDDPNALNNLSIAYRSIGENNLAHETAAAAVALAPENPHSHNNLAISFHNLEDLDKAEEHFNLSLRLKFDPAVLANLSGVYFDTGRIDECLAALRRAIDGGLVRPDVFSSWLHALLYHPQSTNRSLRAAHEQWNAQFAPKDASAPPINRQTGRPLRLGLVSPDFREHPVARNILPLLKNIDRGGFQVLCYSDAVKSDALTEQIRSLADEWRNIAAIPDARVEKMIREDGVDVLVDLAQHTSGNRLVVFSRKPAALQVSWAGYPGSTGLVAIDARLSDRFLDPPGIVDDPSNREIIVRLPGRFWCYEFGDLPDIAREPGDAFTFGSLCKFAKINAFILDAWAQILNQTPGTRLLILAPMGSARAHVSAFFHDRGIGPDRVLFESPRPRIEFLRLFNKIDVMLDVFPYNGHSTALDALSMGVPVISLAGETPVSRGGLSLLSALGLERLVASDRTGYVRLAVEISSQPGAFDRNELRARLLQGELADGAAFARGFEKAIVDLWKQRLNADSIMTNL